MWGFQQAPVPAASDDPAVDADLCGKTASVVSNPDVPGSLTALQHELSKIPITEKAALAHAQGLKPEIFNDDHVLQFLWAEKFDAAVRVDCTLVFVFNFLDTTPYQISSYHLFTACCQETCSILERPLQIIWHR